jgi:hypothetical protein
MTGVFHIRGSKLNGSDRPMTSLTKSAWAGLSTKFRSAGITADGTDRTAEEDARSHPSPIVAREIGAGYVRQSAGRLATATVSIARPALMSTAVATRSMGSRSASAFTNRSSAASESVADVKTTGAPLGVQRLP